MTKRELNELKREVKKVTGMALKDIAEISMVSDAEIEYGYYKTNYDRVTHHMSYATINR